MSEVKSLYNKILQQFLHGSILVKLKARRLYQCFASWTYGKEYKPFDDLSMQEQKKWAMIAYEIPASVEWSDDESVGHDEEEV